MAKVKSKCKETNTDSLAYTNMMIDEIVNGIVLEAVKHFETSRPRNYEDDSRFFYNKNELELFWELFKGDPKSLKCSIIPNDNGGVFCYEICRIERKYRV